MTTPLDAVKWIHGAPDCALSTDPLIQVHPFDNDTFILRLSKCYSFEGNFIYLLFGNTRAVVFDTGGPPNPRDGGEVLTIRQTVDSIIDGWAKARPGRDYRRSRSHWSRVGRESEPARGQPHRDLRSSPRHRRQTVANPVGTHSGQSDRRRPPEPGYARFNACAERNSAVPPGC